MKKGLFEVIIILSMIFCAAVASASALSISLEAPPDGTKTTAYTQEFIYSFDEYATILNCSIVIDGTVKKVMNSMINIQNNKIKADVEPGTHDWFIKCYDDKFTEIVSATQSFTLQVEEGITGGFTKISNDDSTLTYVLTIAPGQEPVPLPAAKGGDEIKITLKGKNYYIDIIKMGTSTNGSFVDVRDRSTSKPYTIHTLSEQGFDFDKDNLTDINLQLDKVERSRDAYFTVIPYPDQATAQVIPTPTPQAPEEELIEEETPVEEPTESGAPTQPETEPEVPDQNPIEPATQPQAQPEEETEGTSMLPIILVLAIVIVVVIIIIVLIAKKKEEPTGKKEEAKKAAGNKKQEAAPTDTNEKPPEIIASTGKKTK